MNSKLLVQLEKLIALAAPPKEGPDGEAKAAAMKACALIRDNNLVIIDPKAASSHAAAEASLEEQFREVCERNPVRDALRRREEERARQRDEARRRASSVVGG